MVYLDSEYASDLKTSNVKLKKRWIGPIKIQAVLDDSHYMISTWDGHVLPISMHANRLKPFSMQMGIVEDGQLVTVSTVNDLFKHIRKMRSQSKTKDIIDKHNTSIDICYFENDTVESTTCCSQCVDYDDQY